MPLLTWAPAQDTRQPGILAALENAWPTSKGYSQGGALAIDTSTHTSTGRVTAGISVIRPNGQYVGFVGNYGTPSRIENYADGSNMSRAGNYTNSTTFSFASTTDYVYAVNGSDALQRIGLSALGTFADVANCPRFKIIITANSRLWGFNTVADITYAPFTYFASGARWWVPAVGNNEDFAPSIASGAATDTLDDQDGEITAAIEFNTYPLVFKRSAIYVLEDNGADVFERRIHGEFGCVGRRAVTKCDNRVYFWSPSNGGELCMYDGSTVTSLSRNVLANERYVGKSAATSNASGGNVSTTSVFYGDTYLATDGRYVMALQHTIDSAFSESAKLLVFDTATGRFGNSDYLYNVGDSGSAPTACWTNAENSRVIAIQIDADGRKGGAIQRFLTPNAASTAYAV